MTEKENLINNDISDKIKLQITNFIIETVVVWKSLPLNEIVEYCKGRNKALDEKDILEVCKKIPFNKIRYKDTEEVIGLYCYIDYNE